MNQKTTTRTAKVTRVVLFGWTLLIFCLPNYSYGATAAEVLKNYERLTGREREVKLLEGAKREAKLVYYGSMLVDQMKRILDEFNKKYPFITVGSYRAGALDVYNRITTEALAKRHEADVAEMDPGEVFNLVKTGLVDPYRSPSRQGIMEEFMDKEGYWTAFYHLTMVLGYNPKSVKKEEAPKSYEEVLDSKWKGKISLDTDDVNVMGTLLDYWGKEKGLAYYRKLAENDPVIRRGKNLQAQILSAGDVSVAPFLYGFQPLLLKQKGAPVEINLLNPTLSSPSYLVLLKNASHPHAAALFLDWALSQEGPMRILTEEFGRGVPRSGYKERYPELSVSKYLATAPEKIGPFYQEYRKTYCEIFKHC
jgi:iron(III) transport system substrate-binding protein